MVPHCPQTSRTRQQACNIGSGNALSRHNARNPITLAHRMDPREARGHGTPTSQTGTHNARKSTTAASSIGSTRGTWPMTPTDRHAQQHTTTPQITAHRPGHMNPQWSTVTSPTVTRIYITVVHFLPSPHFVVAEFKNFLGFKSFFFLYSGRELRNAAMLAAENLG